MDSLYRTKNEMSVEIRCDLLSDQICSQKNNAGRVRRIAGWLGGNPLAAGYMAGDLGHEQGLQDAWDSD